MATSMALCLVALTICVYHTQADLHAEFNGFLKKYRKVYSPEERVERFKIYEKAKAEIDAHNAQNHSWTMGVNQLTDLTWEEIRQGFIGGGDVFSAASGTPNPNPEVFSKKQTVDWKRAGKVTKIRGQRTNDCAYHATIGNIESLYAIKTGRLVEMSEQYVADCNPTYDINGAADSVLFRWIQANGVCSLRDYPYTGSPQTCRRNCTQVTSIRGWEKMEPRGDENKMANWVTSAPVSGTVQFDQELSRYSGGIFDGKCTGSGQVYNGNHAVVFVGYTRDYWLIKNSWGTGWGEAGYLRIKRGVRKCGIATNIFRAYL